MTERREYDEATKAAVMAALLTGQSVSVVASEYKIPLGTVKRWSAAAKEILEPVRSAKKERIGELVLDNLEASLLFTKSMADVLNDAKWLKKQRASEIAVLYGVVQDKTYRVLEALPDSADDAEIEGEAGG